MDVVAEIQKSIGEIKAIAEAGNVTVTKQLGELSTVTTQQNQRILELEQMIATGARAGGGQGGGNPIPSIAKSIADHDQMKLIRAGNAERVKIEVAQSLRAITKSILTNAGQGGDSPSFNFPSSPEYISPIPTQSPGRKLQVLQALPH